MSKVGILAVVLRTLGLIALLFSSWWWVGLAGFLLLIVIMGKDAKPNPIILVYSDGIRMATEIIFLFVGAWGISTLPFLAEQDRAAVLYGAVGFAVFTLLWHPFLILLLLIYGAGRRAVRGY
jgi:hypothetical protein